MGEMDILVDHALNRYYRKRIYDWTSGNLDYMGFNSSEDAVEGDDHWVIFKLTWNSGNLATFNGPNKGSWTGRALLPW